MSLNTALASDVAPPRRRAAEPHPVTRLIVVRVALGVLTLAVVSVIIFAATVALPGNAATAILGHSATPAQLRALDPVTGVGTYAQLKASLDGEIARRRR